MNEDNLLEFFLRKGLTPSFSFPLQVATFVAEGKSGFRLKRWASTSQDLKVALSEYTPGKILMIDGVEYEVNGLSYQYAPDKVNKAAHVFSEESKALRYYTSCRTDGCGWVHNNVDSHAKIEQCPICNMKENIRYSRYLEPEGFAPEMVPYKNEDEVQPDPANLGGPTMKASPVSKSKGSSTGQTGRVEMPAPLLDEDDVEMVKVSSFGEVFPDAFQDVNMFSSPPPEVGKAGIQLILVNTGYQRRGYYICTSCGRAEVESPKPLMHDGGHFRPYAIETGKTSGLSDAEKVIALKKCKGSPYSENEDSQHTPIMLGMIFHSDMISFRFQLKNPFRINADVRKSKQLNGGLYAIKEALITEIQKQMNYVNREIGGGIRKFARQADSKEKREDFVDIFLYDEVSGGAGLVTALKDSPANLTAIFANVKARLSGSSCLNKEGCEKACIGCLLDFRNKSEHSILDRHYGLSILHFMEHGEVPSVEAAQEKALLQLVSSMNNLFEDMAVVLDSESSHTIIRVEYQGKAWTIRPVSFFQNPDDDPLIKMDDDYDDHIQAENVPSKSFEFFEDLEAKQLSLLKKIRASLNPVNDLYG